jgi:hypothetical protein
MFRVFENGALMKIFGQKGEEVTGDSQICTAHKII